MKRGQIRVADPAPFLDGSIGGRPAFSKPHIAVQNIHLMVLIDYFLYRPAQVFRVENIDLSRNPAAAPASYFPCSLVRTLRSEEHTSELPSLIRTSYAVF